MPVITRVYSIISKKSTNVNQPHQGRFALAFCLIFLRFSPVVILGKAQRLKQAKEEAQAEIEAYRQERERQYRDHEARVFTYILILLTPSNEIPGRET